MVNSRSFALCFVLAAAVAVHAKWQLATRYAIVNDPTASGVCDTPTRVVGTHIDDTAGCTTFTCTYDSTEMAWKSAGCVSDTTDPVPTEPGYVTQYYDGINCQGDMNSFTWGSTNCFYDESVDTSYKWTCDAVHDASFQQYTYIRPTYLDYTQCQGNQCAKLCKTDSYETIGVCTEGYAGEGNWHKTSCITNSTVWRLETTTAGCFGDDITSYGYRTDFCSETACNVDSLMRSQPVVTCSALADSPLPDTGLVAKYFNNDNCDGDFYSFSWTKAECFMPNGQTAVTVECSTSNAKVTICSDIDCTLDCNTKDEVELGTCVKLSNDYSVLYECAGAQAVASLVLVLLALSLLLL